ncbi:MAG: hypothetical protein QM758_06765 [Armatimonas sp.]
MNTTGSGARRSLGLSGPRPTSQFQRRRRLHRRRCTLAESLEVVTYDPLGGVAQPPYQIIPPPPMAGEIVPICQALQDQIESLAGARPIAQGQLQGQLSGLAIDLLQQANNTQHNQLRENIEQAEAELGDWIVFLFAKLAGPAPRLLGLDSNNNPDSQAGGVRTLIALKNGGSCRVRVTPGSASARTPAAQRAFVIELRGLGVFGPFQAPEQIRSIKRFVEALNDAGSAKILRQLEDELARLEAEQQQQAAQAQATQAQQQQLMQLLQAQQMQQGQQAQAGPQGPLPPQGQMPEQLGPPMA